MSKLIVFLFCVLVVAINAAKFPATWKKCKKTNDEECLKKAIADAIRSMKDGNKELNVLPLDPLRFEKIVMDQGSSSPVNINLTFTDLDVIGSSRVEVTSVKIDWDNYSIEIDAEVHDGPAIIQGDYNITGKVLVLPIKGNGKSKITLDNFSVLLTLNGNELIKNGKKYFNVEKGGFTIRSKKVHFYFENLFDGKKELGDNMNKFLNENWQEIMNELNGTISKALGLGVKEVASNMLKKIPITELYN